MKKIAELYGGIIMVYLHRVNTVMRALLVVS